MPRKQKSETTNAVKSKPETPRYSQIILEYSRFGNIGFSQINEVVDISGLTQRKFAGKISTLFHFVRNTIVTSNLNSGRTATFTIDSKPILSITQKANDYDKNVFTVTKYKEDGTRKSTRKYSYIKTKNIILQAYSFIETDIDTEESDTANFGDDISNEFDEIDLEEA